MAAGSVPLVSRFRVIPGGIQENTESAGVGHALLRQVLLAPPPSSGGWEKLGPVLEGRTPGSSRRRRLPLLSGSEQVKLSCDERKE